METRFKIGDIVVPKYNFDEYFKDTTYQIINKKTNKQFISVYNLYCIRTGIITNYPSLFALERFKKV